MNIEVRGKITERDYMIAQWVHIRPRPLFAGLGIFILLAAIAVLCADFASGKPGAAKWWALGGLLYLILSFGIWVPYKARRTFRQYKAIQAPFTWRITDAELHVESERGSAVVPWSDFIKWRRGCGLFLIYPNDSIFHLLPDRLLSSKDQIRQIEELLHRSVKT